MKQKKIILIGGGGHCKSCIDIIEQEGIYQIEGILDISNNLGKKILGYPIIGCDEDLNELVNVYDYFFITLGQISSAAKRIELYTFIKTKGKEIPTIVSPLAYISKHAVIGEGSIIMHNVIVNSNASIGSNCIINTGAIIEHDVSIGDNNHISTSCTINGFVSIGNECFIASKVAIRNNLTIGNKVIVGIGGVILKDIKASGTYIGNPLKLKK